MMGTECSYGSGKWDVWDDEQFVWVHTKIPCTKFSPDAWHHIQLNATADHATHKYTFQSIVVDGHVHNLGMTFRAKYKPGWSDNLGVQYQLDVNPKSTGYHVWTDKSTLKVW